MASINLARCSSNCAFDLWFERVTIVSALSTVARTCSVGLPALDTPGSTRQQSKNKILTTMHRARRMAFIVALITTALILLAAVLVTLPLGSLSRVRHLFFFVLLIIAVPLSLSKQSARPSRWAALGWPRSLQDAAFSLAAD